MPVSVRDVYCFMTGVTKATAQGRSESQLLEWLGSNFHKVVFGGEMELCCDIMLCFAHTNCAPLLRNLSRSGWQIVI